jgi:hypothetical protein
MFVLLIGLGRVASTKIENYYLGGATEQQSGAN